MRYIEEKKNEEKEGRECAMKKTLNILMVGVGGQGIILSSDILTLAAVYSGYDAKKSEIHGMSQRGGSVFSHIRFGEKIYSPVISKGETDFLISLEEMEALRWLDLINKETCVIFTKTKISPYGVTEYPEGIYEEIKKRIKNTILIDPATINKETGHQKFLNIAILGHLSNYITINKNSWQRAINELVPEGTVDKNLAAFNIGQNLKGKDLDHDME